MRVNTSMLPMGITIGNIIYYTTMENYPEYDMDQDNDGKSLIIHASSFENDDSGNVIFFEETGYDEEKLHSKPEYILCRMYLNVVEDIIRLSETLENTTFILTRNEDQPMTKALVFMNGGVVDYDFVHDIISDAQQLVPDYNYAYMKDGQAKEELVIQTQVDWDSLGLQ